MVLEDDGYDDGLLANFLLQTKHIKVVPFVLSNENKKQEVPVEIPEIGDYVEYLPDQAWIDSFGHAEDRYIAQSQVGMKCCINAFRRRNFTDYTKCETFACSDNGTIEPEELRSLDIKVWPICSLKILRKHNAT